jgi:hypothetical protein
MLPFPDLPQGAGLSLRTHKGSYVVGGFPAHMGVAVWPMNLASKVGRRNGYGGRTVRTRGNHGAFTSTHLVMCMRYDHASTSRTHGPFGERTRFGETLRPFLRSRDDLPPIGAGGICKCHGPERARSEEEEKSTGDRRNPTGVLLFVHQRVSPNSKSYSTAAVQVTGGRYLRACHSYGPEGQMVGWSRATARVSFERSSVPRREVARFHRRGMWHAVSNRNSLLWRTRTSTSHVWHSTSTADPKSTTSLNEMCVGGRPSKRTGGTGQGCGVGQRLIYAESLSSKLSHAAVNDVYYMKNLAKKKRPRSTALSLPETGKERVIDLGLLVCPAKTGSPLYPNPHAAINRLSERAYPVPLTRRDGDQASSIVLAIDAGAKGKGSNS